MNPYLRRNIMFLNIDNAYGTDLFTPPAPVKVKPHKLPKTKRGTHTRRSPVLPSTIIKNFLLS
jgi:hypothetical protein